MTKQQLLKSILKTFEEGLRLIEKKNSDYAKGDDAFANFRLAKMVGVMPERAILVRISDKLARISNLIDKKRSVKDEKITDSIIDCINYLAILKVYLNTKNSTRSTQ